MTTDLPKIAGILLAAGASRGLGHPKQLVVYEGKTLLRRSAEALAGTSCSPAVAVLGAVIEPCIAELPGLDVHICLNQEWAVGMSSSIRAGLHCLMELSPAIDAVLITLCDQPYIKADDLEQLLSRYALDRPAITAARYNDVIGVPAVFDRSMFDALMALTEDQGARHLIRNNLDVAASIDIPAAAFDVDNDDDLQQLLTR